MKILFVANTPRDPNQGASGCDIATMDALRSQGHSVDEIWGDDMPHRIRHPNLHQLLELPGNFAAAVERQCQGNDYDVIQVNQPHAYLAARQHRRRHRRGVFINRSHGWEPAVSEALARYSDPSTDKRPLWRRLASRPLAKIIERHNHSVVRWADGIIVCSLDDLDFLLTRHNASRERVLALAPGLGAIFATQLPPPSDARWLRVLYVGNFIAVKAPHIVARAITQLLDSRPDATATWVCAARDHDAARQLTNGDHAGRLSFRDWMPREELIKLYDHHGLLIFPSFFEGFAQTPLEAMARGMCVLSTAIDGMRQTIQDGVNGFLFERGAADPIAVRAAQLMASPQQCEQISSAAAKTASGFTWQSTAHEYVRFCQRLMSLKTGSPHPSPI